MSRLTQVARGWSARMKGAAAVVCVLGALVVGTNAVSARSLSGNGGGASSSLNNSNVNEVSGINSSNVSTLAQKWKVQTDGFVSHKALVDNGRVYFTDWGGHAYSVDEKTGAVIWKKQLETPNMKWAWHGLASTGVIYNGMLIEASVEGKAWALDLNDGHTIWSTSITSDPYAGSLGTLLANNGLVYIGLQSVDEVLASKNPNFVPHSRGGVVALNTTTGQVAWRLYTVPANANGGAVWSSFALSGNTLYFGTGNNYTPPTLGMTDSIVAANATTGKVLWYQQAFGHDAWTPAGPVGPDYDYGAGPQLFVAPINGKSTLLVGDGEKSGIYWVYNAETGAPVWRTVIGYGGVGGGIRGEAAVSNGVLYLWSNNSWSDTKSVKPSDYPINVEAIDAATGDKVWVDPGAQPAMGSSAGVLANDVYFVGSLDGTIQGYNSSNGKVLYKTTVPASVSAPLQAADGMLFVGLGAPTAFNGQPGNAEYAFSVAETATATPTKQPAPAQTQTPAPITPVISNPWGYNFTAGNLIYHPPSAFCTYFKCIANFWTFTNGYVEECKDGAYSHSGGQSGACSDHGGDLRPLYSH